MNCPVCGNGDHVYRQGCDPKYGDFVLCSLHGIQVVKKDEHKEKKEE